MKKILSVLLLVLFVVLSPRALAAEESKVLTMEASETTAGVITVTGTTKEEVIAVSVSVYDESGNFIKIVHGQVNDDNTYSVTIEMEAKKYILRTADYNGGAYLEKTVEPSDTTTGTKNVKTGDNIMTYVLIAIVSVIALVGISRYIIKNN